LIAPAANPGARHEKDHAMRIIAPRLSASGTEITFTKGVLQRVPDQVRLKCAELLGAPIKQPTSQALGIAASLRASLELIANAESELKALETSLKILDGETVSDDTDHRLVREVADLAITARELRAIDLTAEAANLSDVRRELEDMRTAVNDDLAVAKTRHQKAVGKAARAIAACIATEGCDLGRLMEDGLHKFVQSATGVDLDPDGTPAFGEVTMDEWERKEPSICSNVLAWRCRNWLESKQNGDRRHER
jgi:hypothetical protein